MTEASRRGKELRFRSRHPLPVGVVFGDAPQVPSGFRLLDGRSGVHASRPAGGRSHCGARPSHAEAPASDLAAGATAADQLQSQHNSNGNACGVKSPARSVEEVCVKSCEATRCDLLSGLLRFISPRNTARKCSGKANATTPLNLVRGGSLATASLRPDPPCGNCPPAPR